MFVFIYICLTNKLNMKTKRTILLTLITIFLTFTVNANSKPKENKAVKTKIKSKSICFKSATKNYCVEIYNMEGDLVKKADLIKKKYTRVSTSKLKPGKYFIRYIGETEKNNFVKKITLK